MGLGARGVAQGREALFAFQNTPQGQAAFAELQKEVIDKVNQVKQQFTFITQGTCRYSFLTHSFASITATTDIPQANSSDPNLRDQIEVDFVWEVTLRPFISKHFQKQESVVTAFFNHKCFRKAPVESLAPLIKFINKGANRKILDMLAKVERAQQKQAGSELARLEIECTLLREEIGELRRNGREYELLFVDSLPIEEDIHKIEEHSERVKALKKDLLFAVTCVVAEQFKREVVLGNTVLYIDLKRLQSLPDKLPPLAKKFVEKLKSAPEDLRKYDEELPKKIEEHNKKCARILELDPSKKVEKLDIKLIPKPVPTLLEEVQAFLTEPEFKESVAVPVPVSTAPTQAPVSSPAVKPVVPTPPADAAEPIVAPIAVTNPTTTTTMQVQQPVRNLTPQSRWQKFVSGLQRLLAAVRRFFGC